MQCNIQNVKTLPLSLSVSSEEPKPQRHNALPLAATDFSGEDQKRFWSKVIKKGPDDCWPWTGHIDRDGYGFIHVKRRECRAHRFSLALKIGVLHLHALHTCDNPTCCNPAHLFEGTNEQNIADKTIKGRCRPPLGERNGFSKLTEDKVRQIRSIKCLGYKKIAKLFGMSMNAVRCIRTGQTWRHLL